MQCKCNRQSVHKTQKKLWLLTRREEHNNRKPKQKHKCRQNIDTGFILELQVHVNEKRYSQRHVTQISNNRGLTSSKHICSGRADEEDDIDWGD